MIVTVRLFARARDLAGAGQVTVQLPDTATAGDLRRQLAREIPALAGLLGRSALAVNDEFSQEETPLSEQSEVALLPPVSGGGQEVSGEQGACRSNTLCP
jgi:molybdopterin converting factor subunit 1